MFTGIITEVTAIKHRQALPDGLALTFERPAAWQDLQLGESIATNGVCLTVALLQAHDYICTLVPETLHKTAFGIQVPATVNLERSLEANGRLGGHLVQGHVDSIGRISRIIKDEGWQLEIDFPAKHRALVIPQGSITINGVSLTVARLRAHTLSVALVPHTLAHTTLGSLQVGNPVNLEFDIIGKYIVNYLERKERHAAGTTS